MTWQPIFDDTAAIHELAAALPAHTPADITLGAGRLGPALFHAYLGKALGAPAHAARAAELVESCLPVLADRVLSPALYEGFTGLAWTAAHLGLDLELDEIDDGLRVLVASLGGFDLIRGLAGVGVYALERGAAGEALLALVVRRLDALAEPHADGAAWFTPVERMGAWKQQRYPRGCHDLGMAHGQPAVIALLAGAIARDVERPRARRLLAGATRFLLAQRSPDGFGEIHGGPARTRIAWCYGDLGIAASLLVASAAAPELASPALALALAAAARPRADAGVVDAGLCHGAAGVAHLFNRLYQATAHPALREAARGWLTHALTLRAPEGVAGFYLYWRDPADPRRVSRLPDASFLQGASGVGLALLAATTALEPAWDRALLVS